MREAGQTLSHYRLVEKIGEGGMGVVWLAQDTKLRRDVALKFLPEGIAKDADRLARFEREARMLAALNDANVAAIFEMDNVGDEQFLVLEYVPGVSLAERLKKGPLPVKEALKICCDLARGLETAHAKGMIHRDLKPANVQLTPEGKVKVLDFGLAKALGDAVPADERTQQMTVTAMTGEYTVVGTVPYMSPEQAAASPVDKRTDVWAFGCILYELLTGQRAFAGETVSNTLTKIQGQDPDWERLPAETPAAVQRLLHRCVEKDTDRRLRDIGDARIEIEDVLAGREWTADAARAAAPARSARRRGWVLAILSVLVVVGLAVVSYFWFGPGARALSDAPRLANPIQVTSTLRLEEYPTWSPDGRTLAYSADGDIWIAQIGVGNPINRTADHPGVDSNPAWSPDGQRIAFRSARNEGGIYIMPALAGAPQKFSSVGRAPSWSPNGSQIAYSVPADEPSGASIEVQSVSTRESQRFAIGKSSPDLSWSPDGGLIAYTTGANYGSGLSNIHVLHMATGKTAPLTRGSTAAWSPSWSPDGRWVYFAWYRDGGWDLWRVRVLPEGRASGDPQRITVGLRIRSVSFAHDGSKLAYATTGSTSNLWRVPILTDRPATWADAEQITAVEGIINMVSASPDRRSLFISMQRAGNSDLWRLPTGGGELERLTTDAAHDFAPALSPSGDQLVFYSTRSGNRDIWLMPLDGGPARQLTQNPGDDWYPIWSPDGSSIAFTSDGTLKRCAMDDCQPVLLTDQVGGWPDWSPDGAWLACHDRDQVWRIPAEGGDPQALTRAPVAGTCCQVRWSADGREVYFLRNSPSTVWAVTVKDGVERPLANLVGKPGRTTGNSLATDGEYIYFAWSEARGDIWVADILD